MFKKRNFSLAYSPSARSVQESPIKRTKLLSSTLKTPNLFQEARANSSERTPLFSKLSESLNLGNKPQLAPLLLEKDPTPDGANDAAKVSLNFEEDASNFNDVPMESFDYKVNSENIQQNGANFVDTPPQTPLTKTESKIEQLLKAKAALNLESKRMDEQLESKFAEIKSVREKTLDLQYKDATFNDYLGILCQSHIEIRNLLNETFNPGNELARKAGHFIEEVRRRHNKKYEKVSFEVNHLLETTSEAVKRKFKDLEHNMELHKRTLMTIECQKRHEESQNADNLVDEGIEKEKEEELEVEPSQKTSGDPPVSDKSQQQDDDCVIIDDNDTSQTEVSHEVELRAHTPENPETTSANNSCTTVTYEEDDEATDIDEPKDEDEEPRSFTPCQAQRPN